MSNLPRDYADVLRDSIESLRQQLVNPGQRNPEYIKKILKETEEELQAVLAHRRLDKIVSKAS